MSSAARTKFLLPVSGDEYSFREAPWNENVTGGNCYSYAIGHYKASSRTKAMPGDIAMLFDDMREPYGLLEPIDLTSCTSLSKRIIADGIAMKRILNSNQDGGLFNQNDTVIKPGREEVPAPSGHYKIMTVVDPDDFHFFRQDIMDLYNIYTCALYTYHDNTTFRVPPNPYEVLKIDAFTGSQYISDAYDSNRHSNEADHRAFKQLCPDFGPAYSNADADLNRAITNVLIHVKRVPEYVIREGNFIVDPYWLLDCSAGQLAHSDSKCLRLQTYFASRGKRLHAATVVDAIRDAKILERDPRGTPKKHELIGLWSQKLGFATPAINTDANRKLIFNPRYAAREFGSSGLAYKTICNTFYVERNHGMSSLPEVRTGVRAWA